MNGFVAGERKKHLFTKPLVIDISARLRIAFLCTLLRTKEEIVHMEDVAVVNLRQKRG